MTGVFAKIFAVMYLPMVFSHGGSQIGACSEKGTAGPHRVTIEICRFESE